MGRDAVHLNQAASRSAGSRAAWGNAQVRAQDNANKRPIQSLASIACVVCAVAAIGLAVTTQIDVSMFGFPDTDYQRAAGPPLKVISWAAAGLGLLFLGLAVSPIGTKVRTGARLAALYGLVLVALGARIGIPWHFGTHLSLDIGTGG